MKTVKIPVRVKSAPKKPRCKEYDAVKRVLDYFYGKFEDDDGDFYQDDLVLGVGSVTAKVFIAPETWDIMEDALVGIMEYLKEEYAYCYDFSEE